MYRQIIFHINLVAVANGRVRNLVKAPAGIRFDRLS